jgi:carboxyl-terminal processing protease
MTSFRLDLHAESMNFLTKRGFWIMSKRIVHLQPFIVILAVVAGMALIPIRAWADPRPEKHDQLIAKLVCEYLKQGHLNKPEIGDELSRRLFRRYLKALDPAKLYFTKSDVDEFKKQETELDDMVLKGDISFAYTVYAKFLARLAERQKLVEEFVAAAHDFTVKESISTDNDKIDYADTDEAIRERWRKRIKLDLLLQRIAEKPVPESEAKQKVLERYKGQLKRAKQMDNADLVELYLTELTTSVDPHSTYMSPATLDDFEIAMRLNLDGIGAVLRSENGHTIVVEVVPGGAAGKDGRLKPNDKIVGVAQGDSKFVDAVDMKLRDVVKLIRGPRGTKVRLKVIPVGKIEPLVYDLTRQKIEMKSQEARGEVIQQGKKADGTPYLIGVIDLPSFYFDFGGKGMGKSCTEDVRKLLKEFETKKVDGVVLDLRRNGGGALGEALALTGLFIDEGPVVVVKGPSGRSQLDDPEKGTVYGGPLIVLVSRFSASASEILAGALQDYGRALIVGDTATHGKGTVQKIIDLGGGQKLGALKLTIQQFYRVNGDSTQSRGVQSDIVIPSLSDVIATNEKELDFALPFDKVAAADHAKLNMVPADVKSALNSRSQKRIKESKDFNKLAKEIELFKSRKDRKSLPLNEKELREQYSKEDAEKIDQKLDELDPDKTDMGVYKFKRNFANNEVLQIMEDYLQERKLAQMP